MVAPTASLFVAGPRPYTRGIAGGCFRRRQVDRIGLALAKESSHGAVCWLGGALRGGSNGTTLWQGKCASTPECIAAVLARRDRERPDRPRERAAVDLALARAQSAGSVGGLPGCAPCQGGLVVRLNKTDANDAEGLARSCAPAGTARCRSRASTATSSGRCWEPVPGWWPCIATSPTRSAAPDLWPGAREGGGRRVRSPCPPTDRRQSALVEVIQALLKVWRIAGEQLVTCTGACCGSPRPTRPAPPDDRAGGRRVTAAAFLATWMILSASGARPVSAPTLA